ncbi:MAG: orotate phosphoribosyltransferase [Patescibacteria group bacterium]|nr:orotate phosphoribosyltransferase [Patescibacteria group bacterium]MDD5715545.1 orotate phosphoribosyltransferase [Patescibacteria group bacterium]
MKKYKKDFIEFLATTGALKFGEFTLKSGRKSPYFFTTGNFNAGETIYRLGYFYAAAVKGDEKKFDIIFGPAYKGIPLAVSTSIALAKKFKIDKGYLFDRKETKEYGDKSAFVGCEPRGNEKILLIDDVMTTGKTKEDAVEKLRASFPHITITGLVIALNREETDADGNDALKEFEKKYSIPVTSIITIHDVLKHLHNKTIDGKIYLDDVMKENIERYLKDYGV